MAQQTGRGKITILDHLMKIHEDGDVKEIDLGSDEDRDRAIESYFGVVPGVVSLDKP